MEKVVYRSTYEPKEGAEVALLLETKQGGQWVKFEEGVYTRKK
jgi:hypothetical protein